MAAVVDEVGKKGMEWMGMRGKGYRGERSWGWGGDRGNIIIRATLADPLYRGPL